MFNLGELAWVEQRKVLPSVAAKPTRNGREDIAIPSGTHRSTYPVQALCDWIAGVGIERSALFRPVDRQGRLHSSRLPADAAGYSM